MKLAAEMQALSLRFWTNCFENKNWKGSKRISKIKLPPITTV